jgi:hypothetical protein
MGRISKQISLVKKYPDVTELYRRKEAHRKSAARRPVSEKMAIASRLREAQERLAPARATNKARRSAGKTTKTS